MADLLANYESLRGELSTMNSRVQQFSEVSQQLRALADSLPGNALGGAAMLELVTHLNDVQQVLSREATQYLAMLHAAINALRVTLESFSAALTQAAGLSDEAIAQIRAVVANLP